MLQFPKGSKYANGTYFIWGLKSINRTYFGLFGALEFRVGEFCKIGA